MVEEKITVIKSYSEDETVSWGKILGGLLKAGDIVGLIGGLGAGKTYFVKGVSDGLGIPEDQYVASPTFTLINEYPGRLNLVHLDVYRLSGSPDLLDLGYEEYFFGKNVTVIEWAEKIQDVLPDKSLFITLTYLDHTLRRIEISGEESQVIGITSALKNGGF